MKRKQRLMMMLIATILSVLLVYGMFSLQVRYIKAEQMIPVIVANKWLPSGHIITTSDLRVAQYPKSLVTVDILSSEQELLNKELIIPLGQGEPLADWKLNTYHLLPQNDEATFQIPSTYIKSIASDIRAGDYIYLYSSNDNEQSKRLFAEPIKVASVKSSTNNEVESVLGFEVDALIESNKAALYQHRRKATGVVEYINLNLQSEQWLLIDELCKDGQAQLIIAYTPYYVQAFDENQKE